MSEHWKSIPKYWCKFCKIFVKDTKLSRLEHDATPRHQGNIQRSLRGLHKEKEQEDRQKQRAKDEVARLNGLSIGKSESGSSSAPPGATSVPAGKPTGPPKKASLEDRKKQMQQLADMGIAIPEEFRQEMGMAGDWQTVRVTQVAPRPADGDLPPEAVAFGVRKRKFEDQEEEEAIKGVEEVQKQRGNWGSKFKSWGKKGGGEDDLDALISGIGVKKEVKERPASPVKFGMGVKKELAEEGEAIEEEAAAKQEASEPAIKKAESDEEREVAKKLKTLPSEPPVKSETAPEEAAESPVAGIVFKKRKKIAK